MAIRGIPHLSHVSYNMVPSCMSISGSFSDPNINMNRHSICTQFKRLFNTCDQYFVVRVWSQ